MTDTEKTQLRHDLMEQFQQMMADDVQTGQDYLGDVQPREWAPQS